MNNLDNIKSPNSRENESETHQGHSKITIKGLDDEVNGLLDRKLLSHNEVLNSLLIKIEKIDFHKSADIDTDKNLKQFQTIVICIEQVLKQTKLNDWGICQNNGSTYIYNGAYWQPIEDDKLKIFLGQAAEKQGVSSLMARHYDFRDKLLKQFKNFAHLPAPISNKKKVLINLLNGTLEVSKGNIVLRKFKDTDFLTYQLPFKYDRDAKCPIFNRFLGQVLPEKELQNILAEYMGYVFIPHNELKLEKALLLYGSGANGKSVFFDVINALFGKENVSSFTISNLTDETGYYRTKIADKLLNYGSELSHRMENSLLKQLISGEPVSARLPYGNPITICDYAKLVFNANELPKDIEYTHAFFRRFIIIPFRHTIPEDQQDKELASKIIKSELPGVLNWILNGLKRLTIQKDFTPSEIVKNAVASFKKDSDNTLLFMDEFSYQPDNETYHTLKTIYSEYRVFCIENNYKPLSNINFKKRLNSHGFITEKKNVGQVIFLKKVHNK